MSSPRVFVSSTFYDLRQIREDLDRFIESMGFEPIRHESGAIPYAREAPLEESAYREAAACDILLCIIGSRYGTASSSRAGSITQNEIRTALERGRQVYIFVESAVHSEYSTYEVNKGLDGMKYKFVDNPRIYEFIESLYDLPQNNPITPFRYAHEICSFLKRQWAGLFKDFLGEQRRVQEVALLEEMRTVAGTLRQMVDYLATERKSSDATIKNILMINHPIYRTFQEVLKPGYRVFFTSLDELNAWLKARSYVVIPSKELKSGVVRGWRHNAEKKLLSLKKEVFESDGRLRNYTEVEWKSSWITIEQIPAPNPVPELEVAPLPSTRHSIPSKPPK